ncbi:hypothetical protein [Amycolatopsis sp.]|uniref:hypothetical protein n=1 Tax=Amycolatopsis sp. TaxID=37632 RepID=UPI002E063E8D|nr:hypothetical protein [Amycolatopsis sp.]
MGATPGRHPARLPGQPDGTCRCRQYSEGRSHLWGLPTCANAEVLASEVPADAR